MKLSIISQSAFALSLSFTLLNCGGKVTDPGSNTNWLKACDTSSACGPDLACICGICTLKCNTDSVCSGKESPAACGAPSYNKCAETAAICQSPFALVSQARPNENDAGTDMPPTSQPGNASEMGTGSTTNSPSAPPSMPAVQGTQLQVEATKPCGSNACSDTYGCQEVNGPRCSCPTQLPACAAGSLQTLPAPAGFPFCTASNIAADGSAVIGLCMQKELQFSNGVNTVKVVRWPANGTVSDIEQLFALENVPGGVIIDVSQDGTKVLWEQVLTSSLSGYVSDLVAMTSKPIDGNLFGLNEASYFASGMSADGQVIVGSFYPGAFDHRSSAFEGFFGFRLRQPGLVNIINPAKDLVVPASPYVAEIDYSPNFKTTYAVAVSTDHEVVGGTADNLPFVWSEANGTQTLPLTEGATWGSVVALNSDGSIAAGTVDSDEPGSTRSVIWVNGEIRSVSEPNTYVEVTAMDPSGSYILGSARGSTFMPPAGGWIWTPGGTQYWLKELLHVSDEWSDVVGTAFTSDGKDFVGTLTKGASFELTDSVVFRARVPKP